MNTEYTEIFELKKMLEKAKIPFEWFNRSNEYFELYQICYPEIDLENRVCSVIQGTYSLGGKDDLLEIMNLLTDEELKMLKWVKDDDEPDSNEVLGCLTAEDVFSRIEKHYKEECNK